MDRADFAEPADPAGHADPAGRACARAGVHRTGTRRHPLLRNTPLCMIAAVTSLIMSTVAVLVATGRGAPAHPRQMRDAMGGAGTRSASPGVVAAAPVLTGPGCAPAASASGTARTGTGGDGWIKVGGGPAECGGQALATFTTPSTRRVQDTYTWRFRTPPRAGCAIRLFIPDTNPSSASARYDVYGRSKRLGGFTIVQARHKGQWVRAGTWTSFGGTLRVTLTDRADYTGAHHHVTAAAADASCH